MSNYWSIKIGNFLWEVRDRIFSLLGLVTLGARALVIEENKILLIKHTYCAGWSTIGGGVERRERPIDAVQRELYEEVGIKCLDEPKLFAVYLNDLEKRDDYVFLYIVKNFERDHIISSEIAESKWFDLLDLPADINPGTKRRIDEYNNVKILDERW